MSATYDGIHELVAERGRRYLAEAAAERRARTLRAGRERQTMTTTERTDDATLREWARERVALGRRLRLRAAAFALAMAVLAPVWAVSEYLAAGGWPERLSANGNPGDWSPWLIWVALAWAFYLGLSVLAAHFRRPVDEREIERELRRLAARG